MTRARELSLTVVTAVLCLARSSAVAQPPEVEAADSVTADAGLPDGGSAPERLRWGAGVGGIVARADTWDYALMAQMRAFVPHKNWDLGGSLILYLAVDPSSYAEGATLDFDPTNWITGTYGWGFGAGLGFVNFTGRHPDAIWVGPAFSAQAFVKPVVLRFGSTVRVETALYVGAIEYFGWDWKPWAFLSCTIYP